MDSVACHMPHATGNKNTKDNAKISQARCCSTRKPGFPFHSIRTSAKQGNTNNNSTRQAAVAASSATATKTLRLFMSQPHVASSTTENDNEAAVDTCCHLLATLVVSAASVICIKWQQLVGAPHWECHAPFFHSSAACETMHINHDDGNSSSSSTCCSTLG